MCGQEPVEAAPAAARADADLGNLSLSPWQTSPPTGGGGDGGQLVPTTRSDVSPEEPLHLAKVM